MSNQNQEDLEINTLSEDEFKSILGPGISDEKKHDLWIRTKEVLVDKYKKGKTMSPAGSRLAARSLTVNPKTNQNFNYSLSPFSRSIMRKSKIASTSNSPHNSTSPPRSPTSPPRNHIRSPTSPPRNHIRSPTSPPRNHIRSPTSPPRNHIRSPTSPPRNHIRSPTSPSRSPSRSPTRSIGHISPKLTNSPINKDNSTKSVRLVMSTVLAKNILRKINMGELFKIVIATPGINFILDWKFWAMRYYETFGRSNEYLNKLKNKNNNNYDWMVMTKKRYDEYRLNNTRKYNNSSWFN